MMDSPILPVSARGWLEVQELYESSKDKGRKRGESPQKRWVVLDNGVLWIRRSPKDLAFEGSLPMMNAVIERLPEDRRSTLRVRMRGSDREFCLRCEEGKDLSEWEIALTEARRRWAEKRRASALFRAAQGAAMANTNKTEDEPKQNCLQVPEINSLEKNIHAEQARVQRISVPVATRTLTQIVTSEQRSRKSNEGKNQERRKSSLTKRKMPSWKELPEIINTGLPESIGVGGVKAANAAFQLAASEAEYNMELNQLNQLGKRIVVQWNDDPSPPFLRRAVAAHIQRMKALSDSLLTQLESLWAKRPTLIGVHALYARVIADFRSPYVAYSGHLEDIMLIIQRALEVRPDAMWAVSGGGEGGFERRNRSQPLVIAPLQRLTTLRIMLQECTSESIRLREEERANAVSALDTLKEILDESYAEMTTQSGTQFVAEVDNLLDFDEMSSGRSPLSLLMGDDRCASDEDDVPRTSGRQISRPSIFWN